MKDWITEEMLDEMAVEETRLKQIERECARKTRMPFDTVIERDVDGKEYVDASCGGGKMKRAFIEEQNGEYAG